MGYELFGLIGHAEVLEHSDHQAVQPVVPLSQGFVVRPLRRDRLDGDGVPGFHLLTRDVETYIETLSARGKIAYVEVDFFGGVGEQRAAGWLDGSRAFDLRNSTHGTARTLRVKRAPGAVNSVLAWLGVDAGRGQDEFEAIGLPQRRHWHDDT